MVKGWRKVKESVSSASFTDLVPVSVFVRQQGTVRGGGVSKMLCDWTPVPPACPLTPSMNADGDR